MKARCGIRSRNIRNHLATTVWSTIKRMCAIQRFACRIQFAQQTHCEVKRGFAQVSSDIGVFDVCVFVCVLIPERYKWHILRNDPDIRDACFVYAQKKQAHVAVCALCIRESAVTRDPTNPNNAPRRRGSCAIMLVVVVWCLLGARRSNVSRSRANGKHSHSHTHSKCVCCLYNMSVCTSE